MLNIFKFPLLMTLLARFHCNLMWHQCIPNAYFGAVGVKSLADCKNECQKRPRCEGINYKHYHKFCELLDNEAIGTTFMSRLAESRGCVFSIKSQWSQLPDLPACSRLGPGYESWDEDTNSCIMTECGPAPAIPFSDMSGNVWSVGNQVQYRCHSQPTDDRKSTCLPSGQWSTTVPCPHVCSEFSWTSGTNVVWSYSTVSGEQVVTLSCAAKFAPFPTEISATIHCLDTGVWDDSAFACAADTIGHECSESSTDCTESDSLCVRDRLSDTTGICMCGHMFRYDAVARTCTRVCTTLMDTFTVVPGIYITHHNLHFWEYGYTSYECRQRCIQWGDDCLSIDTERTYYSGSCYLNYVQVDQVNDSIPSKVIDSQEVDDVHVRNCV